MAPPGAASRGLTLESPLAARLRAWSEERFPPKNAVFIGTLYLAALLYGRHLSGAAPRLRPGDAVGFLAALGFFLMLRVMDEHKDYELDVKNHPERVLQSGLVTLGHLRVLGALAVAAQLGVTLWRDGGAGVATAWWAATMVWSALMAKEFFAHAWLSRRLVLYAFSHMLVMPLALLWLTHLGASGTWLPPRVALVAGLSFVSGFAFEIARKTRAPGQERDGVDSYTKVLGVPGAAGVIAALQAGQASLLFLLLREVGASSPGWTAGLVATVLPGLASCAAFAASAEEKAAKRVEDMSGLSLVAGYGLLVAAILVTHAR